MYISKQIASNSLECKLYKCPKLLLLLSLSFSFPKYKTQRTLCLSYELVGFFLDRCIYSLVEFCTYRQLSSLIFWATENCIICIEIRRVQQLFSMLFCLLKSLQNVVLSKELIPIELPPWKIWKANVSSVSPSWEEKPADERLRLVTSGLQITVVIIW